jgi:hypothetical protein
MDIKSFTEILNFNATKIVAKVLLETSFSTALRIFFKQERVIKE